LAADVVGDELKPTIARLDDAALRCYVMLVFGSLGLLDADVE
jgi:hypothetical protein